MQPVALEIIFARKRSRQDERAHERRLRFRIHKLQHYLRLFIRREEWHVQKRRQRRKAHTLTTIAEPRAGERRVHGLFVHDTAIGGDLSRGIAGTVKSSNANSARIKLQGSKSTTQTDVEPWNFGI
jgi:hypothetical protein